MLKGADPSKKRAFKQKENVFAKQKTKITYKVNSWKLEDSLNKNSKDSLN